MHLTDADRHTAELEELTFAPGQCSDCGETTHVYHDRGTGEYLCLDCLEGAVRDEADTVNAQEWDWLHMENTRRAQEAAVPALRYAPSADYPF